MADRRVFGSVDILLVVAGALAAPWLAPHDPDAQMFDGLTLEGAPLPPGGAFPLGTDLLGRDLLSPTRRRAASPSHRMAA